MTSFRMRPRFRTTLNQQPEEIEQKLKAHMADPDTGCTGQNVRGHIILKIVPEEHHFWSPQLDLTFEKNEDGGTLVRGLYGPNPTLWLAFAYSYAAISILVLFIGMYGLAKLNLGQDAGILWVPTVLIVLGIIIYISSQIGQKIGAEQTFTLHHFLEDAVGERIHIH
ncbi:MAG: hypothetical protein GY810_14565 [Aureispira sp.]|nr:hypothetical protein [Aureispira sp.]